MRLPSPLVLAPLAGILSLTHALDLDIASVDSVRSTASTLAYDMMTYYSGNQSGQVPGLLPGPCQSDACYYWWEAGAMFGSLINYWEYTQDDSYNHVVTQALQFQIGPDQNFNPPNQSRNMGVDDQDFWAFAAMDAAEANLPDVGGDAPSWLALAQAVYNFQSALWDAATCGGGMRWQVFSFNAGYNLKNTISNGGNFQLAARLARYTGNQTYADWAEKMWNWIEGSPLFYRQDNILYIWDNTDADKNNCSDVERHAWSYNYGTMLVGAAHMYNFTDGAEPWNTRVHEILEGAFFLFFPQEYGGNIMTEFQCEPTSICNNDQSSFKAYLTRWMAVTAVLVPDTWDLIMPKLQASAQGAVKQCIGGENGRKCGRQWYSTTWDGSQGVGQQMCALAVVGATQMNQALVPKSAASGGTSKSDPGAGGDASTAPDIQFSAITTADKAGAAILTILVVVALVGGGIWIIL
ncbi:hypothetical protein PV10_04058 [Exophiala mesophila]|uniref:Mannan endo-1,6-alpha-mannosidase n=1 Tax=Exophiala mesophila TaxID=212818 RepID=A0A0D1ZDK4_EXOME|nr:uncharacterized protein PV10_04058 [Exophiala mesophila]KIV92792.1 hypothetical protein PV10_04058 [Exophiala mesophila]